MTKQAVLSFILCSSGFEFARSLKVVFWSKRLDEVEHRNSAWYADFNDQKGRALSFGNHHSSKEAGYQGNDLATPRCMISATGTDGFGHQLESKLSCMAVAEDIGLDYIHVPFGSMEHGQNGSSLNEYLGLSTLHASWQPRFLREMRQVAWVGKCHGKSWLRDVANGKTCKRDGRTVYIGDNCWDYFYCNGAWPDQWLKVQPRVQQAFLDASKAYSVDDEGKNSTTTHVVLHVRRGDGIQLPLDYFERVINILARELQTDGTYAIFRVQTDGNKQDFKRFEERGVIVDDAASTSLETSVRRMVTADVFVASMSSLSLSAALINTGNVIYPGCASAKIGRRPLPSWRIQPCH